MPPQQRVVLGDVVTVRPDWFVQHRVASEVDIAIGLMALVVIVLRAITGGVIVGVVNIGIAPDITRHQEIVVDRLGSAEDYPEVRGPDANSCDLCVVHTMVVTQSTDSSRDGIGWHHTLSHGVLPRMRVMEVVGLGPVGEDVVEHDVEPGCTGSLELGGASQVQLIGGVTRIFRKVCTLYTKEG